MQASSREPGVSSPGRNFFSLSLSFPTVDQTGWLALVPSFPGIPLLPGLLLGTINKGSNPGCGSPTAPFLLHHALPISWHPLGLVA